MPPVGVGREARGSQRVDGGAAKRRRADHEQHLLGREEHDPEMAAEGVRPPADAVDPDPLAATGTIGP